MDAKVSSPKFPFPPDWAKYDGIAEAVAKEVPSRFRIAFEPKLTSLSGRWICRCSQIHTDLNLEGHISECLDTAKTLSDYLKNRNAIYIIGPRANPAYCPLDTSTIKQVVGTTFSPLRPASLKPSEIPSSPSISEDERLHLSDDSDGDSEEGVTCVGSDVDELEVSHLSLLRQPPRLKYKSQMSRGSQSD